MLNVESQKIGIIVPFYNEEDNVVPLVEEIQQVLDGFVDYEMVLVDDGSTDQTNQRLQDLKKASQRIHIVKHKKNAGQSTSILSGVRYSECDWIVTLDGDGQNNPADIPKIIKALSQSEHPVSTIVMGHRQKRNDSWVKLMSSRIANNFRKLLLRDDCLDAGCGLKIFSRDFFLSLPHFNHFHRFLPILFKRAGGRVINQPISHRPRMRGESKYGISNRLWVGLVDIIGVLWLLRRPCQVEAEYDASH